MADSSTLGKIVAILFVVIVVPFAFYGFWRQLRNNGTVAKEIETTALLPYVEAIKAERFEDAYHLYTSTYFQKEHTLEEFVAAQQANKAELGPLLEAPETTGIVHEQTSPGEPWIYRTERYYTTATAKRNVMYEFEKEQDVFKLRATYNNPRVNGPLEPHIF